MSETAVAAQPEEDVSSTHVYISLTLALYAARQKREEAIFYTEKQKHLRWEESFQKTKITSD